MAISNIFSAQILIQRGHLFPWAPVALACGIGLYFALPREPADWLLIGLALCAVVLCLLAWRLGAVNAPFIWAIALVAAGLSIAGARAHLLEAPVLGWRYYGPVEGRIIHIDRANSGALRLMLDRVVLRDVAPERTPLRVRVSLHGEQGFFQPVPGQTVVTSAHLSPPGGPVEPGGFDFQRHAWFQQLGAVGYTRTPMLLLRPSGEELLVQRSRMALSARVQSSLNGEPGAFAAAIMTGDRSGMQSETLRALRMSNLAHLLAISGLHMGLLAGFIFGALRLGMAAVPWLALRLPTKKIAALGALLASAAYLAMSGGNVATERAFVMVAVALVAVMADRRAISLRAVATAALIVLLLRPEALLGPGFQMSFAATTALVAVFSALRDRQITLGPRWFRPVAAVVISSAVAGMATAPVAAAHFNFFAHFGLPANLLSVPLMGALVMPAAVLAACLLPFGLEAPALWLMGQGLAWILGVAHYVADMDGARGGILTPAWWVQPLLAFGGIWLVLWQGRLRGFGLVPMMLAAAVWQSGTRPDVLVSDTGTLVGVLTREGRALNRDKGAGFIALSWLENDGDLVGQSGAALRWQAEHLPPDAAQILQVSGKTAEKALSGCAPGHWLILTVPPSRTYNCEVYDPKRLRETGALAFWRAPSGKYRIVTARDITGVRLWNDQ